MRSVRVWQTSVAEEWRGMEGISGSWQEIENSQLSPVGPCSQEPTSSALGDLVESEQLRLNVLKPSENCYLCCSACSELWAPIWSYVLNNVPLFPGWPSSPLPEFLGWGFETQVSCCCCFSPVKSTQSPRVIVPLSGSRKRLQATSGVNSETSLLV